MILIDANIWIDYFRAGDPHLKNLLLNNGAMTHPCLTVELALGSLRNRPQTLAKFDLMPQAGVVSLAYIRRMIEARGLHSKGIGLTDAHLIASCLITPGVKLWTRDTRLRAVAQSLGIDAGLP